MIFSGIAAAIGTLGITGVTAAGVSAAAGVAGVGVAALGMAEQAKGVREQRRGQEEALALQSQIESKRQQQLNLDAMRRRREVVRQSLAARALALSTATAQGAGASGTSAIGGAYGQIQGRQGVNDNGIRQNQEIGNEIFGLNRGVLSAYRTVAAGQSMSQLGAGLTSFGGAILNNAGTIGKVGEFAFGGSNSGEFLTNIQNRR